MLTANEAMTLIAKATFRNMDKQDRMAFEGVERHDAMIAEYGEWTIVIDGNVVTFVHAVYDWQTFKLSEPTADELAS